MSNLENAALVCRGRMGSWVETLVRINTKLQDRELEWIIIRMEVTIMDIDKAKK